jgi:hypothetical protein
MQLIFLLISIVLMFPAQTETYYIVKVKGEIINAKTGQTLGQGDAILDNEQLIFGDKDAMALVVSDSKNKYTLKFPIANITDSEQLISSVKKSLILTKKNKINTRSLITNAAIKDLKEFLGDSEFTVIGNSLDVKLSRLAFENKSVEAKFDKNGKPFNKELVKGDTILNLSRTELGAKSNGEVKIYHVEFYKHDKLEESVEKITQLDLNFIDEYALRDELKTIIAVYKKKNYTKNEMKTFLMEYFIDFYGNTHQYILSLYIDKIIEDNMK